MKRAAFSLVSSLKCALFNALLRVSINACCICVLFHLWMRVETKKIRHCLIWKWAFQLFIKTIYFTVKLTGKLPLFFGTCYRLTWTTRFRNYFLGKKFSRRIFTLSRKSSLNFLGDTKLSLSRKVWKLIKNW